MGHPCCLKTNCQNRLSSIKDQFCFEHRDCILHCRVVGCEELAESKFITCAFPTHRAEEEKLLANSQSAFEDLSRRLHKANVPRTPRRKERVSTQLLADTGAVDINYSNSTPPTDGKKKKAPAVRIKMTRRWTHNEQLFVLCCGIIIARSTFFSAEGVSSVAVSYSNYSSSFSYLLAV